MMENKEIYKIVIEGHDEGNYYLSESQKAVFNWLVSRYFDIELIPLNIAEVKEIK